MKYLKLAAAGFALAVLAGCGQVVEVGPAEVGKVMTKNGYKEQVIPRQSSVLIGVGHTVINLWFLTPLIVP